jgi:hypothetical protein
MTHNQLQLQSNKISAFSAQETQRHNVATEVETNRHQVKMEELEDFKNGVLNYQAIEDQRHNRALEDIQRHNVNVEYFKAQENARHNRESERINAWLASTQEFLSHETNRHNKAIEVIDRSRMLSDSRVKSAQAANYGAKTKQQIEETKYFINTMPWKMASEVEDVILKPFETAGHLLRGGSGIINQMIK